MFERNKKQSGYLAGILEFIFLLLIVFLIRTFFFGLYQVPSGSMETTMLIGERFLADKFTYNFRKPLRSEIVSFNDPTYNYSRNWTIAMLQNYVGIGPWGWGPSNWTKRIIGLPGEEIKGLIENGKPVIYVNGKKLDEPYLNKYPLLWLYHHDHPRSYDPSVPFDQQPFYRMKESQVMPEEVVRERYGYSQTQPIYPGTPCYPRTKNAQELVESGKVFFERGSDVFYIKLGPNQYWLMGDNRLGSKDSRYLGPIDGKLIHGKIVWRIWSIDSDESWWILDLLKHPIDFWTRVRWSRFFQFVH